MTGIFRRVTEKERSYINEVLDGEFRKSAEGRMTERLETKFAGIFGVKYAISHVNGTVTMHSALAAAGVGPGDEVIVPALTMASTAFSALYANAKPVFADVSPDTFTIDPEDARKKITPRTRAIIPVSLYGLSPDMDPILELADRYNLTVIEDNAECVLGYYKNRIVGSMGDMASFSFQSSKHLTSGEGGILITDDEELALRARRFGNLGFAPTHAKAGGARMPREKIQDPKFERHLSLGWNYRLSESLCCRRSCPDGKDPGDRGPEDQGGRGIQEGRRGLFVADPAAGPERLYSFILDLCPQTRKPGKILVV